MNPHEAEVLIADVDNTMLPFMSSFLQPAVTAGAARIARLFHMNVKQMVQFLAPTMDRHGHDNPWLIELSGLRERFVGSDDLFIDLVVRPFWKAWDKAAETCGHAYPGVARTLQTVAEHGKLAYALSNGRDFCVLQRLKAAGLSQHLQAVAAVRVFNKGGFDTTVYRERRARILAANADVDLIVLEDCASKPSGVGLLTIMERASADVDDCVFTGDALELDGAAAAAVGMPFVWMANGGVFVTHDFDAMYAKAPEKRPRHNLSVPVRHEAHCFEELLTFLSVV
jgi:FMN phosphatase YigB (HAD superfamily)